jgi:hypothetical protein
VVCGACAAFGLLDQPNVLKNRTRTNPLDNAPRAVHSH